MDIITNSETETMQIARDLAEKINTGDILLLHGNLGMGKSVFARALIRELAGDKTLEVPSPTFTLVQTYDTKRGPLYHFDLYRLKDPEEIYELGWEEALSDSILIVEWPERLGDLKPAGYLDIRLTSVDNEPLARKIQINKVG